MTSAAIIARIRSLVADLPTGYSVTVTRAGDVAATDAPSEVEFVAYTAGENKPNWDEVRGELELWLAAGAA